jgi:phosphoserine aminotransferase
MSASSPKQVRSAPLNFSGGPGALPEFVLEQTQDAIREVPGQGLSILGISHRSPWFRNVVDEAEENILNLLGAPDDYRVLFLQGGGSLQFSMVPMSFLNGSADYLDTGYWSTKAIAEARVHGSVRAAWSGSDSSYRRLPHDRELDLNQTADYFHYVSNETVEGVQFHRTVGSERVLRICDMSSDFLSRPIDITRFGLVYAHAQKNLGPAGVTVAVIRKDVLDRVRDGLPSILDYRVHAEHGSIYNTAPVFAIYVTMLVTRWLRDDIGGLQAMAEINDRKAQRLYSGLDRSSGFYDARVACTDRSRMNVTFELPTADLDRRFIEQAESEGLYGLAGHRTVGGVRASLYNAVTPAAVDALIDFMEHFQTRA